MRDRTKVLLTSEIKNRKSEVLRLYNEVDPNNSYILDLQLKKNDSTCTDHELQLKVVMVDEHRRLSSECTLQRFTSIISKLEELIHAIKSDDLRYLDAYNVCFEFICQSELWKKREYKYEIIRFIKMYLYIINLKLNSFAK
jgi:hypothetical protein